MIYGLFFLIASLTGMFFLFNTGQLSSEKTKLVNTADAVAYSAAVMHARALNFDAYSNRALVANEVLVAQMVSLSSWGQYISGFVSKVDDIFPSCDSWYGAIVYTATRYDVLYAGACYVAPMLGEFASQVADRIPPVTEAVVAAVEVNKTAIKAAETLLHTPALFNSARATVMEQVAKRNYSDDGTVFVEPAGGIALASATMKDDWQDFVSKYQGDDRTRFAEITRLAAYSDNFVRQRSWTSRALLPVGDAPCRVPEQFNRVERRGGTELIGLDEWKAEDTQSSWIWFGVKVGRRPVPVCRSLEIPVATGVQQAYPSDSQQDESGAILGGSPLTNPRASSQGGSSSAWNFYTGLPSFYDLSSGRLSDVTHDPRLQFTVRVVRDKKDARTSGAASQIPASAHLNKFDNNFAGGVMSAMATGEAYFERPLSDPGNPEKGAWNAYAERIGSANKRELASLFNPFWHARLMPTVEIDVTQRQTSQGATLPSLSSIGKN
jgi:hypothetical protein